MLIQHLIDVVYCAATTAAVEGKMSKSLKKLLKKLVVGEAQEQLAVADAKLGNVIKVVLLHYEYYYFLHFSTDHCDVFSVVKMLEGH